MLRQAKDSRLSCKVVLLSKFQIVRKQRLLETKLNPGGSKLGMVRLSMSIINVVTFVLLAVTATTSVTLHSRNDLMERRVKATNTCNEIVILKYTRRDKL